MIKVVLSLLATLLDTLLPRVERSLALRFLSHVFARFGVGLLLGLEGYLFFVHFAFVCFLRGLEGFGLAACVVVMSADAAWSGWTAQSAGL